MTGVVPYGPMGPRPTWCEAASDQFRYRHHAIKRAWQRYGLACGLADIQAAEGRIIAGDAEWLEDQADGRQAWRVRIKGRRAVPVIFSRQHGAIVTVLPEAWAVRHSGGKKA